MAFECVAVHSWHHSSVELCSWRIELLFPRDLQSQDCASVALQHSSLQSCRGELEEVPTHASVSHFAAYEVGEAEIEMYS